jgi:hypothetical protein
MSHNSNILLFCQSVFLSQFENGRTNFIAQWSDTSICVEIPTFHDNLHVSKHVYRACQVKGWTEQQTCRKITADIFFFFHHGATSPAGQGFLTVEDSWSHSDTLQSVGLLCTSDQPDAEICTWQRTTIKEMNIHVPDGIRTNNPSKRTAADRVTIAIGVRDA